MAIFHFDLAFVLAGSGKIKAAFSQLAAAQELFPLLEPKATEYLRTTLTFFTSTFGHIHNELVELEAILEEFEQTVSEKPSTMAPNVVLLASNFAYYQKRIERKFDSRTFANHNSLLLSRVKSAGSKRFCMEAQFETFNPIDQNSPANSPARKAARTRLVSTNSKKMQKSTIRLKPQKAEVLSIEEKRDQLEKLGVSHSLVDRHFLAKIDSNINIHFNHNKILTALNEFGIAAAGEHKALKACNSSLRIRKKEELKPYKEFYFTTSQHHLNQTVLVRQIVEKSKQVVSRSNSAVALIKGIENQPTKANSLKAIIISKKLVKQANLEKLRESFGKGLTGNEPREYNHTAALRLTKDIIKKNLEELEKTKHLLLKSEKNARNQQSIINEISPSADHRRFSSVKQSPMNNSMKINSFLLSRL